MRAIPDPRRDIGLRIMSYFHYRPEVGVTTCRSLEEAQEILASSGAGADSPFIRAMSHPEHVFAPEIEEEFLKECVKPEMHQSVRRARR